MGKSVPATTAEGESRSIVTLRAAGDYEFHAEQRIQPMTSSAHITGDLSGAAWGIERIGFSRIVIVADDLTGACDSGVAFVASGSRVRVVLDASGVDCEQLQRAESPGEPNSVGVHHRNKRHGRKEAAGRVGECITALSPIWPSALAFKKVDSAARGHFGVEISAALRSSGAALALVAPAFPDAGRTVSGGVLHVRDWSGQDG